MRRIIAAEPTKTARERWRMSKAPLHRTRWGKPIKGQPRDRWLRVAWTSPPPSKPKPVRVDEEIWASIYNPRTGRDEWSHAVITSRGGAEPNRITIGWVAGGGRHTRTPGGSVTYPEPPRSTPSFKWPPLPRPCPQFYRTQAEAKEQQRWEREIRRQFEFASRADDGASAEALALLDLQPPSRGRMCRRHSVLNP